MVKATSLRPLMRTRLGMDAEIETDPVEVDPRLPWVEARAGPIAATVISVAAPRLIRLRRIVIVIPTKLHPKWMYPELIYTEPLNGSSTPFVIRGSFRFRLSELLAWSTVQDSRAAFSEFRAGSLGGEDQQDRFTARKTRDKEAVLVRTPPACAD